MITSKIRILTIFLLFFIITFSLIPAVLAKPRKTYITDFLYDCEIKDEGFSNSVENDDDVSDQATAYALEILEKFDLVTEGSIVPCDAMDLFCMRGQREEALPPVEAVYPRCVIRSRNNTLECVLSFTIRLTTTFARPFALSFAIMVYLVILANISP